MARYLRSLNVFSLYYFYDSSASGPFSPAISGWIDSEGGQSLHARGMVVSDSSQRVSAAILLKSPTFPTVLMTPLQRSLPRTTN